MATLTTFEHALLTSQNFDQPSDFDWLLEQNILGFYALRKNHTWQIHVRHYLGVIVLPSGHVLEILPKIAQDTSHNDPANPHSNAIAQTRKWVQTMLTDIWQDITPKALPHFSHNYSVDIQPNLPLSDWLIAQFSRWFSQYQPNQHYQTLEQNAHFLQGKLLIKQQLSQNSHQPHKFYQQSTIFLPDTALNRLIKTAYQSLNQLSRLPFLPQQHWHSISTILPSQIATPLYYNLLYQIPHEIQQLPKHQQDSVGRLVGLCRWLIETPHASFAGDPTGEAVGQALWFNMQHAFEKWVTLKMQQQFSDTSTHFLPQKKQSLTADSSLIIKPDIWLKTANHVQVADIKWKNIRRIHDITLADMYQLMTYATQFAADEAWLIVPTLDNAMPKQQIILAKAQACKFYLVPFWVKAGKFNL